MYLVHTGYIYIYYRFYRAFWGILREQLVRVLLPTFSLGDYHERLYPTPYHFFVMLQQKLQPFIPFWGEHVCFFTVNFFVFFCCFFFTVCFKNSNPLKTRPKVWLFQPSPPEAKKPNLRYHIWLNVKGNLLTCHLFGGSESLVFTLDSSQTLCFLCSLLLPVQEELSVPPSSKPLEVKLMQRRITIGAKANPRENGQTKGETNRERPLL